MAFHPYLYFGGNCREAFTRYREIFGGQLEVSAMSDMPDHGDEIPAEQANLVMHASLTLDSGLLMGSDDPTGGFDGAKGFALSYSTSQADEAQRIFDALADGGEVTMPMSETFWSPAFGMCVDRFGTPWMVDAESGDQAPSGGA